MLPTKKPPTKTPPAPQPITPQVTDLEQYAHTYDVPRLEDFLARVFHTPVATPLVWYAPIRPGYPSALARMLTTLRSTRSPRPLYYGTASVHPTHDGQLLNRKSQFAALHVVVLDDIGTKVAPEDVPQALQEPSYVIESSPGNYQWGYVLREPVRDLEAAGVLVRALYAAGVSDPGGAMPTKLVRLPDGVNAKPGENARFHVKLTDASWRLWSPEELLAGVESELDWNEVLVDARAASRSSKARSLLPWSDSVPNAATADGAVDPVLEWLYKRGDVISDAGGWVQINCPWGDYHTTGDRLAGYMPLGRTGDHRGWKCFHSHCDSRKTREFLDWVAVEGGPEASVYDPSTPLVREWVYDPVDDVAYQVLNAPTLEPHTLGALRNVYRKKIAVSTPDGRVRLRPVTDAWLDHPNKVLVYGQIADPSTTSPLIEYDGRLRINSFRRPPWGGEVFDDDIETWEEWLAYLIPDEEEREYFSDWLAAKFQDMSFRGCAVLMIAEAFGCGRGTLAKMLTTLFGVRNVASVPWSVLVGAKDHNEWQLTPFAITHETLDSTRSTDMFRAYESLKTIVETSPSTTLVNPKHRTARTLPVYTSHLLFSNHEHAIIIPDGDRRLFVVSNPVQPAPAEYFEKLYAWLEERGEDGEPIWAHSVAAWLRERKVDTAQLLAPPPMTLGKQRMLRGGQSGLDILIRALTERWEGRFICVPLIRDALAPYRSLLRIDTSVLGARHIEHAVSRVSISTEHRASVYGKQVRVRVLRQHANEETKALSPRQVSAELKRNTPEKIASWISEILDAM